MVQPVASAPARTDDVDAALRSRDHVAWLGDVLEVIAIEALGRDARRSLEAREVERIRVLVHDPVAAAAAAAIDRLAADLATAVERTAPNLRRRIGDERRRAELGLD